ncbi:hypothetical protein VH441_02860 [Psychrobacter sp. HD31]|uniref:hypothetical protein n=1 Tax=Psychrobacter sp. HD31 TaxID=3112003 RepID=UPI003DA1D58F
MKLVDKITHHLTSIILYGSFTLFIAFICYVIYVVRLTPCSAIGYQQTILLYVDNTIVEELNHYEKKRNKLFNDLIQIKLMEDKDLELNADSLASQHVLFSNALFHYSQNQYQQNTNISEQQLNQIDSFYLQKIKQVQPTFIKPAYEPIANDYYKFLSKQIKLDKAYKYFLFNYINGNYDSIMFNKNNDILAKKYFAKLFELDNPNTTKNLINVIDNNSLYRKIFETDKLVCKANINYPNSNNLLISFTPSAKMIGNIRRGNIRYNTFINKITQNNKPISIKQYCQNLLNSYQNYNFKDS